MHVPKLGEANVLLSQFSGQTVPQPWSGDPKTSIAERWLCSGDRTCVDISNSAFIVKSLTFSSTAHPIYRAMHSSAKRGIAIACCPSVTLGDCDDI